MQQSWLIIATFSIAIILRRLGIVTGRTVTLVTDYVIYLSLPCLSVATLATTVFSHSHWRVTLVAWGVILLGALFGWLRARQHQLPHGQRSAMILVCAFPNTGFLGYPIAFSLFGAAGLSYAVIFDQIGMFPLFLTLGFALAGGRESMTAAVRFPPFIALLMGIGLNVGHVQIPHHLLTLLKWIGWTTLPLTVFLIGAKIRLRPMASPRLVLEALAIRMLLIPGILTIILLVAGANALPYRVAIMEAAMPPALSTSILAMKYGLDDDLTVTAIGLGTVLALSLMPLVAFILS
jgi:predicted permease